VSWKWALPYPGGETRDPFGRVGMQPAGKDPASDRRRVWRRAEAG
jgi:hypothetical protein